ncbi:MAG TPA: AAA family ATPase [Verrucomicrobiae bacterium]|nr:AAA family ATPase [Verrucomicrobiae bacterium]
MPIYALEGGPCAGKTTITNAIIEEWPDVIVVPEAATIILENGYPKVGRDMEFTPEWLHFLQKIVVPMQTNMEDVWRLKLDGGSARLLLCDRGVLSGAAYVPGGVAQYEELTGLVPAEAHKRYDGVIHLESVATANPALWDSLKASNPARYETLDQAIEREMALREVYKGHPNWIFISGKDGIESVKSQVHNLLSQILDVKVERKWRLKDLSALPNLETGRNVRVEQGYITDMEGAELRIRRMGFRCLMAVKGVPGMTRSRWERTMPETVFNTLWPETEGRRILKQRHFVPSGKYVAEVDVFDPALFGDLVVAEFQFKDEMEAGRFELPQWMVDAGAEEVTCNPEFSNRALAR